MTTTERTPADLAQRVVDVLSDRQAEDVVQLDISRVANFTDFFVIATAQNARHMRALMETLDRDLSAEGNGPVHVEGDADSGWVLIDFGDVIAQLFTPEDREYYNLEGLWGRAGVAPVRFQ
ncbi:MAG TPA: ribosome silencing factor [Dehalococcoidia bacterium]